MKFLSDLLFPSSRSTQLGLCLSGGGALGFAHIGVLQALEDYGIYPKRIVGASMGAIVGTLYASGISPLEMLQMINDGKMYKATHLMTFKPYFLKSGLSNHSVLRNLIREVIPHNSFEKLKIPMHICVANLNTADWEIVADGNELDKWVAASASIPGLFEAVKHKNKFYVDGGLLNNMPAQGIESLCQTIIGVNVKPYISPTEIVKPIDTLAFSVRAMEHQNSLEGRNICRFLIEPKAIEKFHEFSFESFHEIYQSGYRSTIRFIGENPEITRFRGKKND